MASSGHWPSRRENRASGHLAKSVFWKRPLCGSWLRSRARVELGLQDSEKRLRQFGEASSDVLWIRHAETLRWTYLTPAFETIYGLER